jgi:hypothetical protein
MMTITVSFAIKISMQQKGKRQRTEHMADGCQIRHWMPKNEGIRFHDVGHCNWVDPRMAMGYVTVLLFKTVKAKCACTLVLMH